jgi:hypothetical protein
VPHKRFGMVWVVSENLLTGLHAALERLGIPGKPGEEVVPHLMVEAVGRVQSGKGHKNGPEDIALYGLHA